MGFLGPQPTNPPEVDAEEADAYRGEEAIHQPYETHTPVSQIVSVHDVPLEYGDERPDQSHLMNMVVTSHVFKLNFDFCRIYQLFVDTNKRRL